MRQGKQEGPRRPPQSMLEPSLVDGIALNQHAVAFDGAVLA